MIEIPMVAVEAVAEAAKTGADAAEGVAAVGPSVPSVIKAEGTLLPTIESPKISASLEGEHVDAIVANGNLAGLSEMSKDLPITDAVVRQAIERESMLTQRSAFNKAILGADSDQARAEITAQYEKESNREIRGGAYNELPCIEGKERHHMPCDYANEGFVSRENGPALVMDKEDHRETASCGRSREACEYREEQKVLVKNGQWEKARQMDIDDIHSKFGSKYDEGIRQQSEYAKTVSPQIINKKN